MSKKCGSEGCWCQTPTKNCARTSKESALIEQSFLEAGLLEKVKELEYLRVFNSIQAQSIQTYLSLPVPVTTGRVCLYRSGLCRFKSP